MPTSSAPSIVEEMTKAVDGATFQEEEGNQAGFDQAAVDYSKNENKGEEKTEADDAFGDFGDFGGDDQKDNGVD